MTSPARGGCLATFLIFMMILNPLIAAFYLFSLTSPQSVLPMPPWLQVILVFFCLLNVLFAVAVWRWRRWGVYGYVVMSVIGTAINLTYLGATPAAFSGLLGAGILWALVRPHWPQMAAGSEVASEPRQ